MKQVCLYIVSILLITTSCTHQDDPMSAITENDSVPLSISSVSLPDVEIGTRNGSIWQANDKDIGLAVYVYPTNGYAEKVVYYQYDELRKIWGPLNGENIYLGYAGAKLLIFYPVTLGNTDFDILPETYGLVSFKYILEREYGRGYALYSTYYHMNADWKNTSSHYEYFASYNVLNGVDRINPNINIQLQQAYAGLKVRLVKADANVTYFRYLKVYNMNKGVPNKVRFNFFTQTYDNYVTASDLSTNLKTNDSYIIDETNDWTATFFVAPNIQKGVAVPMTGILCIDITARYRDETQETRTVKLDLSSTAYKKLDTFTPGKEHVITLTWK